MTKEEFLEAWEGACVEAAVDEWEKARNGDPFQSLATKYCSNRGVQEALIRGAYRAIGSKFMEGLAEGTFSEPRMEDDSAWIEWFDDAHESSDGDKVFRLTLPKEQLDE